MMEESSINCVLSSQMVNDTSAARRHRINRFRLSIFCLFFYFFIYDFFISFFIDRLFFFQRYEHVVQPGPYVSAFFLNVKGCSYS
jgi:hypothetical protein